MSADAPGLSAADIADVLRLAGVSEHLDQALDACRPQIAHLGVRQTLDVVRPDQLLRELHVARLSARGLWSRQ